MNKILFYRSFGLLVFLSAVLWSISASADVIWHKYGTSGGKDEMKLGHLSVVIEAEVETNATFPDDDLVLTVRQPGQKPKQYYFTSSYGYGEVAACGDILLLKYGEGRGTFARVDHIKALSLKNDLEELVDVQSSYYILHNPHNTAPDLVAYQFRTQNEGKYTTLYFKFPERSDLVPSEKIVKLRNDG